MGLRKRSPIGAWLAPFHVPETHHSGRYALRRIKPRRSSPMVFYLLRQVSILLRHFSPSYRGPKMASFFSRVYICWGGFFYKLLCFWVFFVCLVSVCVFVSQRKSCLPVGSGRCVNGFTTPSLLNAMSSSLFSPGLLNPLSLSLWVLLRYACGLFVFLACVLWLVSRVMFWVLCLDM